MATDKEVLQKLFKIARNQQKIIKKLADNLGQEGLELSLQDEINTIITQQNLPDVNCTFAQYSASANQIDAKISLPQKYEAFATQVKTLLTKEVAKLKSLPESNVKLIILVG